MGWSHSKKTKKFVMSPGLWYIYSDIILHMPLTFCNSIYACVLKKDVGPKGGLLILYHLRNIA